MGLPLSLAICSCSRMSSEPKTLPPGEFTLSTMALTSLSSAAFRIRSDVEMPPILPAGARPSPISPSATTMAMCSPLTLLTSEVR